MQVSSAHSLEFLCIKHTLGTIYVTRAPVLLGFLGLVPCFDYGPPPS